MWLLTLALAADGPPAVSSRAFVPRPFLSRPVVELRGGVDSTAGGVPQICGEVHPLRFLSVDACGTGSGWFHQVPTHEMSHYRVEGDLPLHRGGRWEGWVQPGFGFAEVQRGADASGFRFEEQVQPGQVEAAGPEATLSVKGRGWFHERAYVVVEANAGLAWIPGAPAAVGAPTPTVPSAGLSVGMGL